MSNSTSIVSGGIHNIGRVTLTNSTVSGNSASSGGGIYTSGTLTLTNSTVSGNSASASSGGFGGGGITTDGGTLTLTNSTVSGNSTNNIGGGIYNNGGTVTLTNSTVSSNSANNSGFGRGIYNSGTTTLARSIVVNSPSGRNCNGGSITSLGDNISSDLTCFTTPNAINDRINLNPELLPLANNGGPTQTHALSNTSPAINAVTNNTCPPPAMDQRGVGRPIGLRCDIGAVESAVVPVELQSFEVE